MFILRSSFLILLLFPALLYAQRAVVGVHIDHDEGLVITDLPVNFFLVDGILPLANARQLKDKGKTLWVSSGLEFTRRYDLNNFSDSLSTSITDPLVYYRRAGIEIGTYIIASHPQATKSILDFLQEVIEDQNFIGGSRTALVTTPGSAYRFESNPVELILAIDEMSDLEKTEEALALYILPPALGNKPARNLRLILQQSIEREQEVIIPLSYLSAIIEKDNRIIPLLSEFTGNSNPVFALTDDEITSGMYSVTILVLISCWMIFGMFFFSNGAYHNSVNRYFFTHNFYVNDVMNRRLKAEQDIVIAVLIVSLFFGLFLMILTQALNTYLISSSIHVHIPTIAPYLSQEVWMFAVGAIGMFVFISIITLWIYISGYAQTSLGQILQLLVYPLHTVVLAATIMAILELNDAHGLIHLVIAGITLIVVFSCFFFVTSDIAPYKQQKKIPSLVFGPLLFTLTLFILGLFIWLYTPAYDMVQIFVQLLD